MWNFQLLPVNKLELSVNFEYSPTRRTMAATDQLRSPNKEFDQAITIPSSPDIGYCLSETHPVSVNGQVRNCMPVTVRMSVLNLRLMQTKHVASNAQLQELKSFYYVKSAEVESNRFAALNSSQHNPWIPCSINDHYDRQHHDLIDRVETSLNLIERCHAEKVNAKSTSGKVRRNRKSPVTNEVAVRIMTNWYQRNSEHPYPSYETASVMAKTGGISVEQVKKWFANQRIRQGDTKHISQIAKRRKRSRTVSEDDILLTGALISD